MDGEIIKKANKYGIVLFWPRPLKAEGSNPGIAAKTCANDG